VPVAFGRDGDRVRRILPLGTYPRGGSLSLELSAVLIAAPSRDFVHEADLSLSNLCGDICNFPSNFALNWHRTHVR
jgi:hypothetical protein